jgi:hypothetical protein
MPFGSIFEEAAVLDCSLLKQTSCAVVKAYVIFYRDINFNLIFETKFIKFQFSSVFNYKHPCVFFVSLIGHVYDKFQIIYIL